jgi:hypothetical protein
MRAISARIRSLAETPAGRRHRCALHRFSAGSAAGTGGEDVLDLAGADAERQRAKRAVSRGVAVAADDGHARLGQAQFRADDMDDAAMGAGHAVQRDAELGGIGLHLPDLRSRQRVGDRHAERRRRDRVIHRRDGTLRTTDLQTALAEAGKGLRRSDLVHQVEVDIQDGRRIGSFGNDMRLPDFFKECFRHDQSVSVG